MSSRRGPIRCRRITAAVRARLAEPDAFRCAWVDAANILGLLFVAGHAHSTIVPVVDDDAVIVDALVDWCEALVDARARPTRQRTT